jgi:sulfhydrogenase subunit beta (sulfur reductase)
MTEISLDVGSTVALQKSALDGLLAVLQEMGYQTIGPHVDESAITYGPVAKLADFPRGYTTEQDAGKYRLVYAGHPRYFDATPGSQSWKQYFFPPRSTLFSYQKVNGRWRIEEETQLPPTYALIGVRPCELAAIHIQDRVFLRPEWSDPIYRTRRQGVFIVSANCLHPCGTCFCVSMGTGPEAFSGYDLNLTELEDVFLVNIGSEAGRQALSTIPCQPASAFLVQAANRGLEDARRRMGRVLPQPEELPNFLLNNLDHPRWENVAHRCLSCTNCTQVCPTCFCWDVQDQVNLLGTTSKRERVWDSCFNPDYSYISGGNTRPSTRSRYRQWLTHKLASWYHQFGSSGCVGCGRCITWCPAGIDLTEEVDALRKEIAS